MVSKQRIILVMKAIVNNGNGVNQSEEIMHHVSMARKCARNEEMKANAGGVASLGLLIGLA